MKGYCSFQVQKYSVLLITSNILVRSVKEGIQFSEIFSKKLYNIDRQILWCSE